MGSTVSLVGVRSDLIILVSNKKDDIWVIKIFLIDSKVLKNGNIPRIKKEKKVGVDGWGRIKGKELVC